jgi:hypothetical protein
LNPPRGVTPASPSYQGRRDITCALRATVSPLSGEDRNPIYHSLGLRAQAKLHLLYESKEPYEYY